MEFIVILRDVHNHQDLIREVYADNIEDLYYDPQCPSELLLQQISDEDDEQEPYYRLKLICPKTPIITDYKDGKRKNFRYYPYTQPHYVFKDKADAELALALDQYRKKKKLTEEYSEILRNVFRVLGIQNEHIK